MVSSGVVLGHGLKKSPDAQPIIAGARHSGTRPREAEQPEAQQPEAQPEEAQPLAQCGQSISPTPAGTVAWLSSPISPPGLENLRIASGLGVALIPQLTVPMSCRIAVNMAKRAAAGAMSVSVALDDEIDSPFHAADLTPISPRKTQRRVRRAVVIAFCAFAALSFVSYAAYAHQWSELSALRHLGKATLANELNEHKQKAPASIRSDRS
jgi:hypothetical protein